MDSSTIHLLEIHELVAAYLCPRDICACLAVCRQWNATYASALWRDLSDNRVKAIADPLLGVPPDLIAKNARHIRELLVVVIPYIESLLPCCHQLKRMIIVGNSSCSVQELVRRNERLETLELKKMKGIDRLPVGRGLHRFLRHLKISDTALDCNNQVTLWELAENLVTLELVSVLFTSESSAGMIDTLQSTAKEFQRLRRLILRETRFQVPENPAITFFDLGHACPMLEHLEYTQRRRTVVTFPPLIYLEHPVVKALRGRFPCLKSIVLDQLADLQKQDIATIVSDIPTLTRFHGQQFMPLGQATLDSLIARHAHTLTHVNIRQTTYDIHFEGIYCNGSPNYLRILLTAKQILLFPENCPNLVEFHAPMVEATSLVRSAHWACVHSLRVLVLGIFIVDQTLIAAKTRERALQDDLYTDTVRDEPWFVRQFAQPHQDTKRRLRIQRCPSRRYLRLNRAVFERLSHLTTLETLDISNPYKEQVSAPGALSLSFEGGLGKLGQLRRLRTFGFHQYPENKTPRKYEYLWMMQRWPMLQCLRLKECSVFQFEFPFVFVKDWVPGARIMPWTIELDHSERLPYELYRNPFIS